MFLKSPVIQIRKCVHKFKVDVEAVRQIFMYFFLFIYDDKINAVKNWLDFFLLYYIYYIIYTIYYIKD